MNFGREFFWRAWKNKARKFAEKNSPSKFAEKFAGNFPKIRRTKIKSSPQIRSAQPRAQKIDQKSKKRIFCFFWCFFCPIFASGAFSCSPGGQVSPKSRHRKVYSPSTTRKRTQKAISRHDRSAQTGHNNCKRKK